MASNPLASANSSGAVRRAPVLSPAARRRQLWLKLHRWLGLAGLLFMLAFGLTGSVLVMPEAFDALVNPARYPSSSTTGFRADDAFMAQARRALSPADRISGIRVPAGEGAVLVAGEVSSPPPLALGPPGRHQVWIDPQDFTVLDRKEGAAGLVWAMHAIHGHMLLAHGGRTVVAVLGLGLVLISAIGLWLWWPGIRALARGLKWRKAFTTSMNLHRQTGAVMALIMVIEGFTGAWIALPTLFGQLVEPGMASAREGSEGPPPARPLARPRLAPAQAVAKAQALMPDHGELVRMFFPSEANATWSIVLAGDKGSAAFAVDDGTGQARSVRPEPQSRSQRVTTFLMDLHAGHFGPVWASAIFISGLILSLLSVTGLLLWWQGHRKRVRHRR